MPRNEQVRITFYRIDKCGFYGWGAQQPAFGGVTDTLEQLAQWSDGVELSLTRLFDAQGDQEIYPVYLAGLVRRGEDWVLATWNEVPAHESGVASISRSSPVGAPQVHMNQIAENSIPGYATYFWIIPRRNVIASVRFVHNVSGQQHMRAYLERFLAVESRYVVTRPHEEHGEAIAGYAEDGENISQVLYPRFRTIAYVKHGERDYILRNAARIKRIVRRGHVTTTHGRDQQAWEGLVSFIRGRRPQRNAVVVDRSVYVELEYNPTDAELRHMIDSQDADEDVGAWDDMGFKFQGETKTYWLAKSMASDQFEIPVERVNEEVVELHHLAQTLDANRRRILALLD